MFSLNLQLFGGRGSKSGGGGASSSGSGGGGKSIDYDNTTPDGQRADDGSITMNYLHISNQGTQNFGNKYGQNLEPAGEYMSFIGENQNHIDDPNYNYGKIHFDNPLVLEYKSSGENGWKKDLSNMFGGKTGDKLSKAIKDAGFDAVVTYEDYRGDRNWVEIVNIGGIKQ